MVIFYIQKSYIRHWDQNSNCPLQTFKTRRPRHVQRRYGASRNPQIETKLSSQVPGLQLQYFDEFLRLTWNNITKQSKQTFIYLKPLCKKRTRNLTHYSELRQYLSDAQEPLAHFKHMQKTELLFLKMFECLKIGIIRCLLLFMRFIIYYIISVLLFN